MSKDEPNGRIVHTPTDWRKAGIFEDGKKFRVVWMITQNEITKSDLRLASLDPDLKLHGLTMPQAVKVGAVVESALLRLEK